MKKIKLIFFLLLCLCSLSQAQVYTETFEGISGPGKPVTFVNNTQSFTATTATPGGAQGGLLGVYIPGNNWTMPNPGGGPRTNGPGGFGVGTGCVGGNCTGISDKFLDNGSSIGTNQLYSIKTTDSRLFSIKNIQVFISNDYGDNNTGSGSIILRGKKAGTTLFTVTKNSGLITGYTINNGFNFINFMTEGGTDNSFIPIDELELQFGGSINYIAVDNFTWSPVSSWIGGTGNWNTPANWDRGIVPTASVETNISTGTPLLSSSSACFHLTINNSGNLSLALSTLSVNGILTNASAVHVNNTITVAGNFRNLTGGIIDGDNLITLTGSSLLNNGGTISPGNSSHLLKISGGFNNSNGTLRIDIAGNSGAGIDYDKLEVTGSAILTGSTLDLRLSNGFFPSVGQTFTILTATNRAGTFGTTLWPAGVTGTITYNATSAVVTILTALPVRLISFSGSINNNQAILKWQTTNEINMRSYELQWSNDQIHWITINTQPAKNLSGNAVNQYLYVHPAYKSQNFYWLKSIDKDGTSSLSDIVILNSRQEKKVIVYPNPAIDELTIRLPENQQGDVRIIDMAGRIVLISSIKGRLTTIGIGHLSPGSYIINIIKQDDVLKRTFIKR